MAVDAIVRLAHLRIIKASADIEIQLSQKQGGAPAIEILRRLRDAAAQSLAALAFVDITDLKAVIALQNEVKRYDEWVGWMRTIISEGIAYDRAFTEAERNEILELLIEQPNGIDRAVELGLIDSVPHDA